ncbi:ubiquinol-cytochrome C reductase [Auricularia subglabra TFB-10046 SS5]|nr:ubiquinol-cytochrome C reductase [Auricularia subglabra TFB-10046 SS5]
MSLANLFYNTIARRNSVFASTIFAGAFAFGVGLDIGVTTFWDRWNKGKQWKDIRDRYIQQEDSDE